MPYIQEDKKETEEDIKKEKSTLAQIAYSLFIIYVAVEIGSMVALGSATAAIGVAAVAAPVLVLDISERFSLINILARRLAETETGPMGKFKDILVFCGNFLYKLPIVGTSPSSMKPPKNLLRNDLGYRDVLKASIHARMAIRFLVLALFTSVAIAFPPLVTIVGVLAGAYIFSTLACRTADNVKFNEQSKQYKEELAKELGIDNPVILTLCVNNGIETKYQFVRNFTASKISGYDNLNESEKKICKEAKELYAQAEKLCQKLDIYEPEHQKLLTILIENRVTTKDELGKQMQTGLRGILKNAGVSNNALVKCEKASNSFLQRSASATTIQNFIRSKQSRTVTTTSRANYLKNKSDSTAASQRQASKVAGTVRGQQEQTHSTTKDANPGMGQNG